MPNRYSSTKVGTLAPRFMRAVRSLRTILPGKCSTASRSTASVSKTSSTAAAADTSSMASFMVVEESLT